MIRVLLVVCNNTLNGTERYVIDIAKNLPADKFEAWVATPMSGPLSKILAENGLNEFVYGNGKLYKFSFRGLINIFNFIKKKNINVVHANTGILPCIIAKLLNVNLILEAKHGLFFTDRKLATITFFRIFYEKSKEFFVDFFIAESENDKERMIKFFKIAEEKIKIIYNGIDLEKLEKFQKNHSGEKKKKIVIGNIGRLTFQKGQDTLIRSFRQLVNFDRDLELIIIGEGEDKSKLETIIQESDLSKFAEIVSYKTNIFEYFSKFDIFVLTSRYEGIPYVILYAMKLGIPVVSTDVGGINKVIQNNFNGLLTEVDNEYQIAGAVKRLISEPELYSTLQKNALESVKRFDIADMVRQYEELYLSKS